MATTAVRRFSGRPASVGAARAFVAATLAVWDLDALSDVAVLLTSEVTTNAVRHARTAFRVVVERRPGELVVAVHDRSAAALAPHRLTAGAEGGRGLLMVAALAQRWGSKRTGGGKVVWFTVAVT